MYIVSCAWVGGGERRRVGGGTLSTAGQFAASGTYPASLDGASHQVPSCSAASAHNPLPRYQNLIETLAINLNM